MARLLNFFIEAIFWFSILSGIFAFLAGLVNREIPQETTNSLALACALAFTYLTPEDLLEKFLNSFRKERSVHEKLRKQRDETSQQHTGE